MDQVIEDFQAACRLGDTQLLQELITSHPQLVNTIDNNLGWNPVYRTVICLHEEATQLLLDHGANPDTCTKLGECALHRAADNNHLAIAKLLLLYKANPNIQQNGNSYSDGETPLHHAVYKGSLEMLELLLENGADPNISNFVVRFMQFGRAPIHYAAEHGYLQIMQTLIKYHANPYIKDKSGKRALDLAKTEEMGRVLSEVEGSNSPIYKPSPDPKDEIPPIPLISFETLSLSAKSSLNNSRTHSRSNSDTVVVVPPLELKNIEQKLKQIDDMNKKIRETVKASVESIRKISYEGTSISQSRSHSALYEPDAEKTSASIRLSNVPNQLRNFSFGGNTNREKVPMLFNWLASVRLEFLFDILMDAGYDDVEQMAQQMKTSMPITNDMLSSIGIHKPGHRRRLLVALEEEANGNKPPRKVPRQSGMNPLNCCVNPNHINGPVVSLPTLQKWLENLRLGELYNKFIDAGYDDMEHLLVIMNSMHPITEETLIHELGIEKPGHIMRLFAKLNEDCEGMESMRRQFIGRRRPDELQIERDSRNTACELCTIF